MKRKLLVWYLKLSICKRDINTLVYQLKVFTMITKKTYTIQQLSKRPGLRNWKKRIKKSTGAAISNQLNMKNKKVEKILLEARMSPFRKVLNENLSL